MIRVALARSEGLSPAVFARLRDGVPLERRVRSDRYHRPEDLRASIVAFALLQHLWGERNPVALPRLTRGRHGKPRFAEPNGWHFNWSHDTSWCACALARWPVGINVQGPVRFDEGLFDRVAAPAEAHLREPLRRLDDLSALWTRKEAVAKRSGLGLAAGFTSLETVHDPDVLTLTGSDPDLRLSVSAEGLRAGGDVTISALLPQPDGLWSDQGRPAWLRALEMTTGAQQSSTSPPR